MTLVLTTSQHAAIAKLRDAILAGNESESRLEEANMNAFGEAFHAMMGERAVNYVELVGDVTVALRLTMNADVPFDHENQRTLAEAKLRQWSHDILDQLVDFEMAQLEDVDVVS
jgi:hypothetical protein